MTVYGRSERERLEAQTNTLETWLVASRSFIKQCLIFLF